FPIIELRGAIPVGLAYNLNPIGVFIASVIGSTIVSIPLIFTFRYILELLRKVKGFSKIVNFIDRKVDKGMKKLKKASMLGLIIFVGIPLPTTGAWTGSAIASTLKMRLKHSVIGIFLGNIMAGCIMMVISSPISMIL
ncbi:MAG: small multi-drug export protein, partial [Romboutsia sp.]|nr:small multi-drug export protein [Romboutsia sp.]